MSRGCHELLPKRVPISDAGQLTTLSATSDLRCRDQVLRGALSAETDSEGRNILLSKRFPRWVRSRLVVARAPRDLRQSPPRARIFSNDNEFEPVHVRLV